MAPQNIQYQDMTLNLSSDAKPRLKWTPDLHQRFIDAIDQLGGADKATPKSLMMIMDIHGLTLYHLKSHLQKYRLGKRQRSQIYSDDHQEDHNVNQKSHFSVDYSDGIQNQLNESLPLSQALQIQMKVHRKLQEQVQRHLQLRIEAQGRYLQLILKKAQRTLAEYSSSSVQVELAKAKLPQLVSTVETPSSSISVLTSSESSKRKEKAQRRHKIDESANNWNTNSLVLSLMDMHAEEKSGNSNEGSGSGRKRSGSTISDGSCVEQPSGKRSMVDHRKEKGDRLRKFGLFETLDLNSKYENGLDSVPKAIDLNCMGVEQFNSQF
ncbi:hypothetical protein LguiB_016091 [Lonicera macranthoides]